ncbi:MAG: PH domain-containing protein [Nakamurella sp.]
MARSDRATFRLPAAALFVPVLLFVCATPLATAGGAWWVLYIVPVLGFVWVLITHTRATTQRITTFGLLGSKSMAWDELDQLELPDARWAIAVGQDGRRLRLPMVRPRDVPRLVAVSGGSLRLGAAADPAADQAATVTDPPQVTPEPAAGTEAGRQGTGSVMPTGPRDAAAAEVPNPASTADVAVADAAGTDVADAGKGITNGAPLSQVQPRG